MKSSHITVFVYISPYSLCLHLPLKAFYTATSPVSLTLKLALDLTLELTVTLALTLTLPLTLELTLELALVSLELT